MKDFPNFYSTILICVFLLSSCVNQQENVEETTNQLTSTAAFLRGEKPEPIKAKYIDPDSISPPKVVPLKGQLKRVHAHSNEHPVGTPKVVQIPEDLKVITFGKDGISLPKTEPAQGIVVPARHPTPVPADDFQITDAAIYDIQFLSDEQGLSSATIGPILEDRRGHMWFGAGNLVLRYDGENIFRYTPKEGLLKFTLGLKCIVEDSKGNIWFGGNGGVCYYDGNNFVHFPSKKDFGRGHLKNAGAIMEDSKGNIWFYSDDLYRYDGQNFKIYDKQVAHTDDEDNKRSWYDNNDISEIIEDSRGHLWLATLGSGVLRFDGKHLVQLTEEDGLVYNSISNMLEDSEGNIWFGSGGSGIDGAGVSRYTPVFSSQKRVRGTITNFSKKDGLGGNNIREILEDDAGNIWFSTSDGGLSKFDGQNFTYFSKEEGMSSNSILSLMKDRQGNFWAGTRGGGICKFKPNSFRHFSEKQGIGKFGVGTIVEDHQGNIWMGKPDGGILKYDEEFFTNYTMDNGLLSNNASYLKSDKKGNLWIIYKNNNLSKFDGKSFTHYFMTKSLNTYDNPLMDIQEDNEGMIWIAVGWDRVVRLNPETHQFTLFLGSTNELIGSSIFEDKHHNLWIGGHDYVAKYDRVNDQLNFVCQVDTTELGWVDVMVEDNKGNVWLGMPGITLAQVVKEGIEIKEEFPKMFWGKEIPRVYFLSNTNDNDGNLWVGSANDGLSVFMEGLENIGHPNFKHLQFGKSDGLKSNNFRYRSSLLDSKNRLWMGNGVNVTTLDLNNFKLPSSVPKNLGLSHLEIQQKQINFNSLSDSSYRSSLAFGNRLYESIDSMTPFNTYPANLTLPYNLNHLTFHFSANDWESPHNIKYSFKIDGVDEGWSAPSSESKADYRNLSFGTFTLQVKAIGNAKVWSEPFAYSFTISPPWWHTWWAYILYALIVVGSIGGYMIRLRKKLKEKQEQLEREQYLNRELRELNLATSRFVPKDFVQILDKKSLKELHLGDQTEATMTVLFADIRSYTRLSERMSPEENFKFINAYLGRMGPIIQKQGGFICQYFGDGIMALFKDNHDSAVKAAIEMQRSLEQYNRQRFAHNRQPIKVGIGLNTGKLMLGVIGDAQRYDTSVISDAVNTASRMEGLTKVFGCQVIVSEKTLMNLELLDDPDGPDSMGGNYRFLGKVKVKGKEKVLKIYDFYDGQTKDIRHLKSKTKTYFEKALQFYYDQEFGKAADLFKVILEEYPGDIATKYYMDKSVKYIIDGVDEKWNGVEEMVSK